MEDLGLTVGELMDILATLPKEDKVFRYNYEGENGDVQPITEAWREQTEDGKIIVS